MSGPQKIEHEGDCRGTLCEYCGCCTHTTSATKCKAALAPIGMRCPDPACGCEGIE